MKRPCAWLGHKKFWEMTKLSVKSGCMIMPCKASKKTIEKHVKKMNESFHYQNPQCSHNHNTPNASWKINEPEMLHGHHVCVIVCVCAQVQ